MLYIYISPIFARHSYKVLQITYPIQVISPGLGVSLQKKKNGEIDGYLHGETSQGDTGRLQVFIKQ